MIFLTAGHSPKLDPGASGNGYREADLAVELRDKVVAILNAKGIPTKVDNDNQTLAQVIATLNPSERDVCLDIHWNASDNPQAGGVETFIADRHTVHEKRAASELSKSIAEILGIRTRGGMAGAGVKTESESARKKLGILNNELGINLLVEVCFITNKTEMSVYQIRKDAIALMIADFLIKWDAVIK